MLGVRRSLQGLGVGSWGRGGVGGIGVGVYRRRSPFGWGEGALASQRQNQAHHGMSAVGLCQR